MSPDANAAGPNAQTARLMLAVLPALPTLCALAGTLLLFWLFLLVQGQPALDAIGLIVEGAFGSSFAWQSTLLRASPLMFTALCVALPAQVGLVVIGGEGALALGGLAAAMVPAVAAFGNAVACCHATDGHRGNDGGWGVDRRGGCTAAVARGKRDHQQPADVVHRHRGVQVSRGRTAARSDEP